MIFCIRVLLICLYNLFVCIFNQCSGTIPYNINSLSNSLLIDNNQFHSQSQFCATVAEINHWHIILCSSMIRTNSPYCRNWTSIKISLIRVRYSASYIFQRTIFKDNPIGDGIVPRFWHWNITFEKY